VEEADKNSNILPNNKHNFFPCLLDEIKYGNLYNNYNLDNTSINYNKLNSNYGENNNYFIYNYNNIYYKDINNYSSIYPNSNNLYINSDNKNINNFSFYLSRNDSQNKDNLMEYNNGNFYEKKINIFSNQNDIKSINENYNFNNNANNISQFNDHNIFNTNNILNGINYTNYFNNYNNNHINQINKAENQDNNNYINQVNINFPFGKNDLNDFIKYINSLPMNLVNFLCTPKGTTEIQKKLEKSNIVYKLYLINFLNKQGLSIVMKNTYGNYFFQQLIKKNEKSLISLIISYISDNFIDISKDFSGTFSLQALLDEITSTDEEQKILSCIKNYEMEMAFNKNATHVLQKIVLLFPDNHRLYLNEIILNHFVELCLDSNGICLIKIFMRTNTLLENKKRINDKIISNFVTLAESPFGNYGIQYLMEIWNKDDLTEIKSKIMENICELSLQQFSSNVIEKAIEIFDEANRIEIIKKLCFNENFILVLIKNKFGKYVLNKAIKYMKLDIKNELEIKLINNINNNLYNNKDKNKIKKLLIKLKNNKINNNDGFNDLNIIFNNTNNNCFYNNNNIKNTLI
jgi:hypothetical protein